MWFPLYVSFYFCIFSTPSSNHSKSSKLSPAIWWGISGLIPYHWSHDCIYSLSLVTLTAFIFGYHLTPCSAIILNTTRAYLFFLWFFYLKNLGKIYLYRKWRKVLFFLFFWFYFKIRVNCKSYSLTLLVNIYIYIYIFKFMTFWEKKSWIFINSDRKSVQLQRKPFGNFWDALSLRPCFWKMLNNLDFRLEFSQYVGFLKIIWFEGVIYMLKVLKLYHQFLRQFKSNFI